MAHRGKKVYSKKKTAEKTNIIYLLFRVWHFVAIMISPSILGSENGLCQSVIVFSPVSVKMANFGIFADLCTARKEECPQILFHKLVGLS